MALHPVPSAPPPPPGVSISAVVDDTDLTTYISVMSDGAEADPALSRLLTRSFAADPDVRLFVAQLDGRPVGTSIAIRSGAICGVYAVGTQPGARGRGVGTAATWAAVETGREWGCEAVVLQSSAMGLPIYRRMGFRTVVRYITYRG
jgi:GNAT superfamily N-acetyltransferase